MNKHMFFGSEVYIGNNMETMASKGALIFCIRMVYEILYEKLYTKNG